jgi:hypothetical protein
MTTIVYRAGILVGDGRETFVSDGESPMINRDDCVKIFRLPDGRLFGASRTSEDIERMHLKLMKGVEWPKLKTADINAMIVDRKGRVWSCEGRLWTRVHGEYYAVGSGSMFAFPALDAGADARKAVEIACKRDPFSGGKITMLALKP